MPDRGSPAGSTGPGTGGLTVFAHSGHHWGIDRRPYPSWLDYSKDIPITGTLGPQPFPSALTEASGEKSGNPD